MKTLESLLEEYQQLPEFSGMVLDSVNKHGGFNSTPLHIAVYREKIDEVKLLLDAKADPNAVGEYGERPLHVAINCENDEIIRLLLAAGAEPNLADAKGRDAWMVAQLVGYRKEFAEIERNRTR